MTFPQTLIDKMRSREIIPFVGTGVSRAVLGKGTGHPLFPSWQELLQKAADRLNTEKQLAHEGIVRNMLQLSPPNLLEAARYAREGLAANYYDFLKKNFDRISDEADPASLALARSVWSLGSSLVITTNYDRVLSWVHPNPADITLLDIDAPAEQVSLLRDTGHRPTVWHLHGTINNAAKIILTPDGYNRLYPSDQSQTQYDAAIHTLWSLLASRSFLFIGFSLEDEHFGVQLRAVSQCYTGASGPHYALIRNGGDGRVHSAYGTNVQVITFSDHGEPLLALMEELSSLAAPATPMTPASTTAHFTPTPKTGKFLDSCDTPPRTDYWVGRAPILHNIHTTPSTVIAITGIGGQGKSTLIARYLQERRNEYVLVDWRDCKEEANTLHTHIVCIIERITRGERFAAEFAGASIESLITTFVSLASKMRAVFIFDNIDQYISVPSAQAIGGLHYLINTVLRSGGASRFVFTCRPKLHYDSEFFHSIELDGLTLEDAGELCRKRGLVLMSAEALRDVHELTQGHPLWINLIATQAMKGKTDVRDLVSRIRLGKAAGLPDAMLSEVWNTLSPKQQKLLRYLAEAVRPETEKQLAEYAVRDLNGNQFGKAFRALRAVDLLVTKSPPNAPDTFELHPLVREFVRRQFTPSDRSRYISVIIRFFEDVLAKLRPSLSGSLSFGALRNWTMNIELLVNRGDAPSALVMLHEVQDALVSGGYTEEFIRIGLVVLSICDFNDSVVTEAASFEDVCRSIVSVLSEFGRYDEALNLICRFEATSAATSRYVLVCDMRTYYHWNKGEMNVAKEWGTKGVTLKTTGSVDTRHDCSHNLALAQRDSGDVSSALTYFLRGTPLEAVTDPVQILDRNGAFYGNIGRCLFLNGFLEMALICFVKSAWKLERQKDYNAVLNRGWCAFWLGELHIKLGDYEVAFICFKKALGHWELVAPLRAADVQREIDGISTKVSEELRRCDKMAIDRRFTEWLRGARRFPAV
jgi:tetratricopeptide (TPR) repeat protein